MFNQSGRKLIWEVLATQTTLKFLASGGKKQRKEAKEGEICLTLNFRAFLVNISVAMAAIYSSMTCISAHVRGKNGPMNHCVGAVAAASVIALHCEYHTEKNNKNRFSFGGAFVRQPLLSFLRRNQEACSFRVSAEARTEIYDWVQGIV